MVDGADWRSRVAENARRYRELNDRVGALSIDEVSPDGAVRVTVSAGGRLTGLELVDTGRPTPLSVVAEQVMACVRRAQARIPDLLHATVTDVVGDDDPNALLLVSDARQRFPEQPAESSRGSWETEDIQFTVADTTPTPPRRRQVCEEVWDEERTVLKEV